MRISSSVEVASPEIEAERFEEAKKWGSCIRSKHASGIAHEQSPTPGQSQADLALEKRPIGIIGGLCSLNPVWKGECHNEQHLEWKWSF